MIGRSAFAGSDFTFSSKSKPLMSLQAEVEHHAVVVLVGIQLLERTLGGLDRRDLDVLVAR